MANPKATNEDGSAVKPRKKRAKRRIKKEWLPVRIKFCLECGAPQPSEVRF